MKLINVASAIIFATVLMFAPLAQSAQAQCPADVNHDQQVNATDLASVLSSWGTNGSTTGTDINNDGSVNGSDLTILFSGWGPCPSPTWATVLEWAPDAAVVTDATLRNAITASGLPWRVQDNGTGIEMLLVPAGTFTMGCSASTQDGCLSDENPTHQVTLTQAFYMGKTEVTQAQWTAKMGSNPSQFQGQSDSPSRPVERVSWNMIASGSTSFVSLTGLRLPTEAEWEYAYRAGTTTAFHSYALSPTEGQPTGFNDDTLLGNIAWYNANAGSQNHAVGGKLANGLGLHDMSGNVWEWCQDWYGNSYYASSPLTNPIGPATGITRLLRGGSWYYDSSYCRASRRNDDFPVSTYYDVGFRVVRTAAPEPQPTITSITPISGPTAGGTPITITGWDLTGATSVTVGGVAATSVVVVSSTSVTAVTSAGTAGAKSVEVTTPGGTATATNAFTYFAPPTISSVSPATGSTAGGTAITITGANLTGATSVTVGGAAATSVVVVSPTSVTAVTPAGNVGAKSVALTTLGGSASLASAFTYVVPNAWYTVLEQNVNAAVVTNVTMRNAITASGLPWRIRDIGTSIEMLLVPAGTFTMGCSPSTQSGCNNSDESPTHQVTLTQAFYMGRYEVTQAQWTAKMGGYSNSPSLPVSSLSWNIIASGSTSFMSLTGLRLPTEAEWEYAYRAGTTTAFHSYPAQPNGFNDDTLLGNIAWYGSNSNKQTHVVGGKYANGLGLHDMSGNVWEWCQDWYGPYSSASVTNPTGPTTGSSRLVRGGGWQVIFGTPFQCRASFRGYITLGDSIWDIGFRVARTAAPELAPTFISITPISGPSSGGTPITITGWDLTGATSVTVGGVAATSVVVVSSTSVTAVTPAGTVGAKNVAVTTSNGSATATNGFTYFAPPTISSVSPATGSTAGGTAITITGANLTGATSVTVGGVAATSVVVVSATSVTAVTPAGTVGAKSVAVTTPGGSASLASAFTYVVPTGWYTVLEQNVNAAVVTNTTMRNAITASGLPWRIRDTSSNIEMLLVPAGTFTMGCSPSTQYGCGSDESPTHQVTLSAFYMGRYEVTQAQWTAKMGSNPSLFGGYSDSASRPVEQVSWNMIASGSTSFMSLTGLRLPTEAEWEYAHRAGTTTAFHSYAAQPNGFNDDTLLGNIAWYNANAGSQTHAVGGKFANGLGLYDMAGNIWEWCQDWYGPYSSGSVTNPTGPATGTSRLLRGGYWYDFSDNCRASRRGGGPPGYNAGSGTIGFRVVRTP